jgi:hypothetical protein
VPLFLEIWHSAGLGFFKELSGPRLAPSRDVCV